MAETQLTNEEFFTQLAGLFSKSQEKQHGSIFLTQKRFTYSADSAPSSPVKVADDPLWDLHPENPLPVIVRATNGKSKEKRAGKVKLSTVVQPDALETFYARYAEVCKAGMQALKKRDRSKRKKDKAKKRKTGGEGEKKG
ncbi:hypothetical protein W97_04709 [Coniosporium apollinis CBS 100218]|uniref:Signal recognition particle subunit SRP14 n=1 Tax=Coniosporium apollinis (strain CBS 100218) TaxID=1168221 RepID=R7YUW1_CONA1|nr:uncharacterized protein W97_04709 [Coniosporium apollinis CBS 100218]EON65471.1 hypothetical protein W97_04709 [Coniosporium apollinis CBS 100218]